MTTFTTEDRIIAEQNGSVTINVEPIPFAGWVSTSPPHIVDSGASVMEMNANELADLIESACCAYQKEAGAMLRQQAKELDEAGHMIGVLREYISDLENGLDSSIKLNKAQAERNNEQ